MRDKTWFEMPDVRRKRFATSAWVPLRQAEYLERGKQLYAPGESHDYIGVGTVAVFRSMKTVGEKLGWSDLGGHSTATYASETWYKPADSYFRNDDEHVGVELVIVQGFGGGHPAEWHINNDLVVALGLLREGDVWKRVDEGYESVIRLKRNLSGEITAAEMKSEFLRDYLCARDMSLRIAWYRSRVEVLLDASHIPWSGQNEVAEPDGRFALNVFEVDDHGGPYGGGVAVMKVGRTDLIDNDDAPVLGPETDANTTFEHVEFTRVGLKFYRVEGEQWRNEWIDPAPVSERVRGDKSVNRFMYFVDAAGTQQVDSELNDEDIGKWLYFSPQVVSALLQLRGAELRWHTRDTGSIFSTSGYGVHFGISEAQRINVYARDVARLPAWQQRIWFGHNVVPDGPVSKELLDSHVRAEPANTTAPEFKFVELIEGLDTVFVEKYGAPLFRPHDKRQEILRSISRFRALQGDGLLALAKDVARLTADSFDVDLLRKVAAIPADRKIGSLKLLEALLARFSGEEGARKIMAPLVGIYDLRLGDAHMPSSKLGDALGLVNIDQTAPAMEQGAKLIDEAARVLWMTRNVLSKANGESA